MVSCTREAELLPKVWIDSPRAGASIESGQSVMIYSHAFAREGIAEVVLSVDGVAYARSAPSTDGEEFSDFQQEWIPPEDGSYILQLVAYDQEGIRSNPETRLIIVGAPTPVVEVVELPEDNTEEEIVICPPTADVKTGANCRSGPGDVYPVVITIPAGTELNVQGQSVDGYWWVVNQPGSGAECWIWEELVELSIDTCSVAMVESPPTPQPAEDQTPPPAPQPAVPANGISLDCRSYQDLVWVPVQDGSGIAGYYVNLERQSSPGNWQGVNQYGPIQGKEQQVSVECGWTYRWAVRAEDGAGNFGSWSGYSTFTVELE